MGIVFFCTQRRRRGNRQGERERERGRERGTRGKMYQQPSGYEAAGQYDSKYAYDPEMGYGKTEEEGGYATFMEKQVRQGFIRKVFSILAVQLLVTFSCAIGFASSAPLKAYVSQNMWPVYVAFPATFGSMIGLICCGDLHRRFPHNYCLLGVFTLADDTQTVLLAVAITGVITVGLVAYAFQTK